MANEITLNLGETGKNLSAIVSSADRLRRWDGSAMTLKTSIARAAWTTGAIPLSEVMAQTVGTGEYVGDLPPILVAENHPLQIDIFFTSDLSSFAAGGAVPVPIGYQEWGNDFTAAQKTSLAEQNRESLLEYEYYQRWYAEALSVVGTEANSPIDGTYLRVLPNYGGGLGMYPTYLRWNSPYSITYDPAISRWIVGDPENDDPHKWESLNPSGTFSAVVASGATGTLEVARRDTPLQLVDIQSRTDRIHAGTVSIVAPLSENGKILSLVAGDDYFHAQNRAIDFISDDYPSLTSATPTLRILDQNLSLVFSVTGAVIDPRTVRYEIPKAETMKLKQAMLGIYTYRSRITCADGNVVTETRGDVIVYAG